jgi:hypothetical protein
MNYITKGETLEHEIGFFVDAIAIQDDEDYKLRIELHHNNLVERGIMMLIDEIDELGYPVVINIQDKPKKMDEDNPNFYFRRTIISATSVEEE